MSEGNSNGRVKKAWAWLRENHEVVKDMVFALAALVGGVWAILLFMSLHRVELAKAKLAALKHLPDVQVEIDGAELFIPDDTAHYVRADVRVANTGNRSTILDFRGRRPFSVARVTWSDAGQRAFKPLADSPIYTFVVLGNEERMDSLQRSELLPGDHRVYSFVARVDEPGLYFVEFHVPVSDAEGNRKGWTYKGSTFVTAGEHRVRRDP